MTTSQPPRRRGVQSVTLLLCGAITGGFLTSAAATPAVGSPAGSSPPARTAAPQALPEAPTGQQISALVRRLERQHGAHIAVAVVPVGSRQAPWSTGTFSNGPAWSTAKVPVAIAAQRRYPRDARTRARMRAAITASDNAAAEALFRSLGTNAQAAAATTRVIQDGAGRTIVPSVRKRPGYTIFGQTPWGPTNQARFTASLPCRRDAAATLALMGQVRADQRWGLGTIRGARFKGGWGPDRQGRYLVRQMGVVDVKGQRLAVVIAVSGVSFATGTRINTQLARQVAATPPALAKPTRRC
ncbi:MULTISPECIES: hypothetical protein [unclassified Luteococcus]|uniref:hypothetical protein n=1 Tax=unclassified Luteococcus TaxID=2639923 RepID=UPI00313AB0DD